MSGFIYYTSGEPAKDKLSEIGLGHISDKSMSVSIILNGPDGKQGCLYAPSDFGGPRSCRYLKNEQVWVDFDTFWVGYEIANPPTQKDVVRKEIVDGHKVKLSDGWEVTIPLARRYPFGTELPETLFIGKDKILKRKPLKRFAALSAGAESILEKMFINGDGIPYSELWETMLEALCVNYRISAAEATILELITTANIVTMADALVDGPAIREQMEADMQKKRQLEENNMSVGQEG